ncbi:nuclear transport factor 2 family protein [Mucilaginibacter corticis]|uniref:Nuclear transport factor 2 family protein n=1 Tax=Mucilaginibacter corticis TaxID=2597670 RepID=A0A556MM84_9SPHI|nr:nuclear transport factor 2 family protein [Mucilaginibacter corticis]TSJ41041.1 nuclear transport factor 2 family protein [Mucilaginibacter corticis]
MTTAALIQIAYSGFNDRDIDAVFTVMAPDVNWPKAFEGGYVTGHDAVRDYWTRQWGEINPVVQPIKITEHADGKVEVEVHQLVKDLEGTVLFDGMVRHAYTIKDGLLQQMDIE